MVETLIRPAHIEHHFRASDVVRDIVIGMSDGLTVPFALAAGLSGALQSTRLIVVAGLAEIAAGSISMGLGGYLAAQSDAEHYINERRREEEEVVEKPEAEVQEVIDVFMHYGLAKEESRRVANTLRERPKDWVDFMMRFELGLEEPNPHRALTSALTIALSYAVGGLIPLSPYMTASSPGNGLLWSVTMTLCALAVFGYVKGKFLGSTPSRSAWQTITVGGLAAAAAYALARWVS